jgi:phage shock protein A
VSAANSRRSPPTSISRWQLAQDDLGIVLIQKKNSLDASIKALEQDMEQARTDAQEAKDSLMQVKSEIQKLKDEKDRMLAQMLSAQARLKIQNQLDGLSVDAEVRALDNVREHIKTTVAEAKWAPKCVTPTSMSSSPGFDRVAAR